jgi:protein disulfide-isomerase A6
MFLTQMLAFTLILAPSLASAAIFPKDSHVKMLDAEGFKRAMKKNVHQYISVI